MTTARTSGTAAPVGLTIDRHEIDAAVEKLVRYFETGVAPAGLFAPDVFLDLVLPLWREQSADAEGLLALRSQYHPYSGTVRIGHVEPTEHGFVLEFEEEWQQAGRRLSAFEILRAELAGGAITEMSVYCTGDWDDERRRRYAETVRPVRA